MNEYDQSGAFVAGIATGITLAFLVLLVMFVL